MKKSNERFVVPDYTYILREPKKSFLAVVVVNPSKFPLSSEIHIAIETLKEDFDLFFLFSVADFPELKKINFERFTTLEEGIGYTWINKTSIPLSFLNSISSIELTCIDSPRGEHRYSGVTVVFMEELGKLKPEEIREYGKKFITLGTSSINQPILKIQRKSPEELWEQYKSKEEEEGDIIYLRGIEEFESPLTKFLRGDWRGERKEEEDDTKQIQKRNEYGGYNTHFSSTLFPFFRPKFITDLSNSPKYSEWLRRWKKYSLDPLELVASLIRYFDLKNINSDTIDVPLK